MPVLFFPLPVQQFQCAVNVWRKLAQLRTQSKRGFRVNLRYPGFINTQQRSDFLHREFFVVIQRQDEPFAFRQAVDGVPSIPVSSLVSYRA